MGGRGGVHYPRLFRNKVRYREWWPTVFRRCASCCYSARASSSSFWGPLLTSIDDASTIYLGETQSCWGRKKKEKIVRIYLGCPRNCFFSFRIGLFKEMEENWRPASFSSLNRSRTGGRSSIELVRTERATVCHRFDRRRPHRPRPHCPPEISPTLSMMFCVFQFLFYNHLLRYSIHQILPSRRFLLFHNIITSSAEFI